MAAELYLQGFAEAQHTPRSPICLPSYKHNDSCSALLSIQNILFQLNTQALLITFKSSPRQLYQSQVWSAEGKKWSRLCLIFFSPQECKWLCFQPSIKHLYVPLPREADKINPALKARRKWAWQTHSDLGTLSWFALCQAMIAKTIPCTSG